MMIVMLSRPLFPQSILKQGLVIDSPLLMTIPLLILSIGAITFGYLTHELFLSSASSFYFNSLFFHPLSVSILDAQFIIGSGSIFALFPLLFLFKIFLILFISPLNSRKSGGLSL
jgi:hypothetical protein